MLSLPHTHILQEKPDVKGTQFLTPQENQRGRRDTIMGIKWIEIATDNEIGSSDGQ